MDNNIDVNDNYLSVTRENMDNKKIKLLTTINNSSNNNIGTYDLSCFTINKENDSDKYIEYVDNSKNFKIKKGAWYIVDMECFGGGSNPTASINFYINSVQIISCGATTSNSNFSNSKSITLYLQAKDSISFNKVVSCTKVNWGNFTIKIFALY